MRGTLMSGIRRFLRVFSSRRGVIGLMFGLIWGPLIGWGFMAITLSMKASDQYIAESALDQALIAAAATPVADLPKGEDVAYDRGKIVNAYWSANGGPKACGNNATLSDPAESADGTLSEQIQCYATSGGKTNPFVARATVQVQGAGIEVAMVFDNTGSMADYNSNTGVVSTATTPSKLSGLKVAAYNFLTDLLPYATSPGQIKVSLVPMTTDINIGNTTTTQAMVKFSADTDAGILAGLYSVTKGKNSTTCTAGTYKIQSIVGGSTYDSSLYPSSTCNNAVSSFYGGYDVPSKGVTAATWLGCVVDRDQMTNSSGNVVLITPTTNGIPAASTGKGNPSTNTSKIDYDISNALPSANGSFSLFPADNINCGGTAQGPMQLVPLTDLCSNNATPCTAAIPTAIMNLILCRNFQTPDYAPAKGKTKQVGTQDNYCTQYATAKGVGTALNANPSNTTAMIPNGTTDLAIGLNWGWNMLTPGFPLSTKASTSSTYAAVNKILIFFTDGQNTQDRFNSSSGATNMDNETINMCKMIQADQLDPYNSANTITLFAMSTVDAGTVLGKCVNNSDNLYTNLDPTTIDSALQAILKKITAIRVKS